MRKAVDSSNFNKGQTVRARCLGKSVLETVRLVGCSHAGVANIYQKRYMEGETISHQPMVCQPRRIDSIGEIKLLCIVCSDRSGTTADFTSNYMSNDSDEFCKNSL
ncbi:hypothetical protein TNCV_3392781 [Trichonephila clavipes]|nr:hypothetical protein TNCV_3392781 [Trichonephila clavipes]